MTIVLHEHDSLFHTCCNTCRDFQPMLAMHQCCNVSACWQQRELMFMGPRPVHRSRAVRQPEILANVHSVTGISECTVHCQLRPLLAMSTAVPMLSLKLDSKALPTHLVQRHDVVGFTHSCIRELCQHLWVVQQHVHQALDRSKVFLDASWIGEDLWGHIQGPGGGGRGGAV